MLSPSLLTGIETNAKGTKIEEKEDDEDAFDSMGNKIVKAEKKKKESASDKRKAKKERMARKKAGLPSDDEEDDL